MTGTYGNGINTSRMKRLDLLWVIWRLQLGRRRANLETTQPVSLKVPAE